MMTPENLDKIVDGFPTTRAAIKWTLLVAFVSIVLTYLAVSSLDQTRIQILEERLKSAQENRSPYQIRIVEVTNENPFRVGPSDDLVLVNLAADVSPVILLPSGFLKGKTVSVKDKKGDSDKREIKVRAEGGAIDGFPEWTIGGAFASANFVWDGKSWAVF